MTHDFQQYSNDRELFYQRLHTAPGIKLELVTGGEGYSRRAFEMLARQVWSENGRDGYRTIDHTDDGVPLLDSDNPQECRQRISVSHTKGLYAVATLPPAPESTDLEIFSSITALGLDVEEADRTKVLNVRSRFLNEEEQQLVAENSPLENLTAWTCKEAMLKLAMNPRTDIRKELIITRLPELGGDPGEGTVTLSDGTIVPVLLWSLLFEESYVITLAYTTTTLNYLK